LEGFADDPTVRLLISLTETIEAVDLDPDLVFITGARDDGGILDVSEQTRDFLLSEADQARIVDYYHLLMDTEAQLLAANRRRVSINDFMAPLFQQAYQLSLDASDPIQENRAVLLALALYMSNLDLARVM